MYLWTHSKICRNGTVSRLLVKKTQCQLHLLEKKTKLSKVRLVLPACLHLIKKKNYTEGVINIPNL